MTLDWWGLGLQAINVLILVWLLSRVFWRPVAGAITRRQEAAQAMLDGGKTAQAKADAALAEVAETRAGIAAERDTILAEAKMAADTIAKAALKDAKTKADTLLAAARTDIDRHRNTARKENATSAAELSVEIAAQGSSAGSTQPRFRLVPCATGRGHRGPVLHRPRGAEGLGSRNRDRRRDRP
jgi:F-type H+-transporting ATPase subunit b